MTDADLDKLEAPTDAQIDHAIRQTEYKYFGDYEFSEEQHLAVETLVRAASALSAARASARRDAEEIERLRARFSELAADFERRADACHDLNKSDKEQRDRMRLHGKEAAYRHAMVLARAAHTGEG